jgi:hypothetical protein
MTQWRRKRFSLSSHIDGATTRSRTTRGLVAISLHLAKHLSHLHIFYWMLLGLVFFCWVAFWRVPLWWDPLIWVCIYFVLLWWVYYTMCCHAGTDRAMYCYAECPYVVSYAECLYAECQYIVIFYAECRCVTMQIIICWISVCWVSLCCWVPSFRIFLRLVALCRLL